jgi:hypothetical protein
LEKTQNFESVVIGKKFDLFSIDGPWGSDEYSRIDMIRYIPEILCEDFVIMVDDYERLGEKDIYVITSEKWKFLISL